MTVTSPVSPRPVDGKVIPEEVDLLGALHKVKQDEPAFGVKSISKIPCECKIILFFSKWKPKLLFAQLCEP
jgi:hypothetical protein